MTFTVLKCPFRFVYDFFQLMIMEYRNSITRLCNRIEREKNAKNGHVRQNDLLQRCEQLCFTWSKRRKESNIPIPIQIHLHELINISAVNIAIVGAIPISEHRNSMLFDTGSYFFY